MLKTSRFARSFEGVTNAMGGISAAVVAAINRNALLWTGGVRPDRVGDPSQLRARATHSVAAALAPSTCAICRQRRSPRVYKHLRARGRHCDAAHSVGR